MLLGDRVSAAEETGELRSLMEQLAKAPRRRDFKTVPMILDTPDLWDAKALDAIIAYRGSRKQVWDNTEIDGPRLNLMRNSLNAQVFSFRHPIFWEFPPRMVRRSYREVGKRPSRGHRAHVPAPGFQRRR
jgi:hypothetical protein